MPTDREGKDAPPASPPPNAPSWWSAARAKFTKGCRVRLSAEGHVRNLPPSRRSGIGVVVGFSRDGKSVIIVRDGLKTRESYHPDFWERIHVD